MTRIEILAANDKQVRVALYYPIPTPSPDAVGKGPAPAGIRLDAPDVQKLLDGEIMQVIRAVDVKGLSKAQARTALIDVWTSQQAPALERYNAHFKNESFVGIAWDGTTWS